MHLLDATRACTVIREDPGLRPDMSDGKLRKGYPELLTADASKHIQLPEGQYACRAPPTCVDMNSQQRIMPFADLTLMWATVQHATHSVSIELETSHKRAGYVPSNPAGLIS